LIADCWDGDISAALRGMHEKPAVDDWFDVSRNQLLITDIWSGAVSLIFPGLTAKSWKCGPLRWGADYRFSFS